MARGDSRRGDPVAPAALEAAGHAPAGGEDETVASAVGGARTLEPRRRGATAAAEGALASDPGTAPAAPAGPRALAPRPRALAGALEGGETPDRPAIAARGPLGAPRAAPGPRASDRAASATASDAPVTPVRAPRALAPARRPSGEVVARAPGERTPFATGPGAAPSPRDLLRRRDVTLAEADPAPAPAIYANRSGQARLEALRQAGGTEETEAAVLAGLRYLRERQRDSGAWGDDRRDDKYGDVRVGKSALALLAFLGSGYTHRKDGEFRECVSRGIAFLLAAQDERSGHVGRGSAYGHGIATYALAEAFALTGDEALRQPLWRATQRILSAQVSSRRTELDGGWSYYYADEDRRYDRWPRLSVGVWQIMALESARIGGVRVPDEALARARTTSCAPGTTVSAPSKLQPRSRLALRPVSDATRLLGRGGLRAPAPRPRPRRLPRDARRRVLPRARAALRLATSLAGRLRARGSGQRVLPLLRDAPRCACGAARPGSAGTTA
ncbi:MAG: hypothetical protein R3F20_02920 [Planctomycetota bacterium]